MKTRIITLTLCLLALNAQAQTDYEIEQRLDGRIVQMQINKGWKVNLVYDTVNAVVIHTPCEYFFTEGNEPNLCRLMPDGVLSVWENRTMPQGTRLDIHYREPFESLYLHPDAIVSSNRLLLRDTVQSGHYGDIDVKHGATLRVRKMVCNGFLSIEADSNATVRIDTVSASHLMLWSQRNATLMLDSIEAKEVDYRRDPLAHDNLWISDPARNLKVKTRNRWFMYGLKDMSVHIDLAVTDLNNYARYDSPYSGIWELKEYVGFNTNHIPFSNRFSISLGLDFTITGSLLNNEVTAADRQLQFVPTPTGRNLYATLIRYNLELPLRLYYKPMTEIGSDFFENLHFGLTPSVLLWQGFSSSTLQPDNRWHQEISKVRIFQPVQVQLDFGYRFSSYNNVEFNITLDLLPTYRKGIGMDGFHALGFQVRF